MARAVALAMLGGSLLALAKEGEPAAAVPVRSDLLTDLSFKPPFESFDADGGRVAGKYMHGGSAEVKANYVRITPDRASKRGWLWSREAIGKDEFTITVRFRVSGQGKRLFGDGFALWVTQDDFHQDGALHGYKDKFTGFGVIFDTFVNTDPGHVHKDVALVSNDGTASRAAPHGGVNDPQAPGCDGDFRFHEGRDDFNPAKARAAARIHYDAQHRAVTVELDARNTGEWVKCIEAASVDLPADWHKSAHIGVTATTGQLADNHDIISLQVLEGNAVAEDHAKADSAPAMISTGQPKFDSAAQTAAAREAAKVKADVLELHHELEHHIDRVTDGLKNALKKLEDAEKKVEERVTKLEASLKTDVTRHVERTVRDKVETTVRDKLGDSVRQTVDSAVASAKRGVEASLGTARELGSRMQRQLDELRGLSSGSSSGSGAAAWGLGMWALVVGGGITAVGLLVVVYQMAFAGAGARRRGGGILPGLGGGKPKDHFL